MRKYKGFDLFSQLLLLVVILTGICFQEGPVTSISLILFAVLQIISLFVHLAYGKQDWKESLLRKIHLIGTGIVLLTMIYGLVKPHKDKYDMSGLDVIVYALVPAAVVAFFYTVITFLERKKVQKRP